MAAKNLEVALDGVSYTFMQQTGVPSTVYQWSDMVDAVYKTATVGIAGSKFYCGTPADVTAGLANVAAFIAQSMQETIQYDACDENNWSDPPTQAKIGGADYPATAACGQLGQSYQDYTCSDMADPQTGENIPAAELQCEVDPSMVAVAETHALWHGAPPPLFCAPTSMVPKAPHWNFGGWCPSSGTTWNQKDIWAQPFGTMSRGDIYYGPSNGTGHVPPEVLAKKPTYIDYVVGAIDKGSGDTCIMSGECCMDIDNQRAGHWQSCAGAGCANVDAAHAIQGAPRTDVEGCCWWGRGVIQTTGVCNFGKLNYFVGKKAFDRGVADALYPSVDFCKSPGTICTQEYTDLKWVAGLFYWLETVQAYDKCTVPGDPSSCGNYMDTLKAWVANGSNLNDHSLIDFASGVVNRGCWNAPAEGTNGFDPCGNGEVHGTLERRHNFKEIINAMQTAGVYPV